MPDLTTAQKIAAIEASGFHLAWDGCHKIYLLDTPAKVFDANDTGYSVFPADEIRELISLSCALVFVSNWGRGNVGWDHAWNIDQFTEDVYEAAEATSA